MPIICPQHNLALVERPAGVSKTTGKPYAAFMACPGKNPDGSYCRFKPPKPVIAVQQPQGEAFRASVVLGAISAKLDRVLGILEANKTIELPTIPVQQPNPDTTPLEDIPF